jgi:hypothetical protein
MRYIVRMNLANQKQINFAPSFSQDSGCRHALAGEFTGWGICMEMEMNYKYSISDVELPGNYRLDAFGNTPDDFLKSATVTYVTDDGDEVYTESLDKCDEPLFEYGYKMLISAVVAADENNMEGA